MKEKLVTPMADFSKEIENIKKTIVPSIDGKVSKLENDPDVNNLTTSLDRITSTYGNSNSNVLELSAAIEGNSRDSRVEKTKKKMLNLSKLIDSNQIVTVNELLYSESSRLRLYENYAAINNTIAQLPEAIQTYVDNIISPDDFSRQSINVVYDTDDGGIKGSAHQELLTLIRNKCDKLKKLYNVETRITKYLTESLTYGDHFVAVLKLSDQIREHLLSEEMMSDISKGGLVSLEEHSRIHEYSLLDEHNLDISDIEAAELKSIVLAEIEDSLNDLKFHSDDSDLNTRAKFKELNRLKTLVTEDSIKKEIAEMVNNNVIFRKDTTAAILSENNEYSKEYLSKNKEYFKIADEILSPKHAKGTKSSRDKADDELDNITGSIIKELDKNRTIKLWADGFCYGYYYIDVSHNDTLAEFGIRAGNKDSLAILGNSNVINQERLLRSKEEFIYSILVRNIAKKLNKTSILKNLEFKKTIYHILRQNYIFQKKIQILYFSDDEVVHFMPNSEESEYGTSVYKDILFTAKIYIAVLTSTLMIKIVRSPDKRIWYIDIGMDRDQEEVINNTMNDIKGRDIRMNDFDDIGKVMRHMGNFDDVWIPTFNGEKPLEVDNLEGQSAEVENDFLNYLKKTFVTGMGVPSPYMNDTDDIELARMISMINGKFVRRTITKQNYYTEPTSKFIRLLFSNEYGLEFSPEIRKDKKSGNTRNDIFKDASFDINRLIVKFPIPSALSYSTVNEQISGAKEIIEFVTDILTDEDETNDGNFMKIFKKNVAKSLIPSIEWEKYEEIKKNSLQEKTLKLIKNDGEETAVDSNDDSYGSGGGDEFGGGDELGGEDELGGGDESPGDVLDRSGSPEEKDYTTQEPQNESEFNVAKKSIQKGSDEDKELSSIEQMERNI